MPKPVTIAGMTFASVKAAKEHCRTILYADQPGTEVTGKDAEFVEALLCARADKLIDLHGLNVIRYLRDKQPGPLDRTTCFYAELEDGTLVHFSFQKAIEMIAESGRPA